MKKKINKILFALLNQRMCVGDASNELEKLIKENSSCNANFFKHEIETLRQEIKNIASTSHLDDIQLNVGDKYIIVFPVHIKVKIVEVRGKTVTFTRLGLRGSDVIKPIKEFKEMVVEKI